MIRIGLVVALIAMISLPAIAADTIDLTISSDIPGATVYINGIAQPHATPLVARFTAPKGFFKAKTDCITTAAIQVRWVSGAEASLPGLSLCAKTGKKQVVSFNRPTGLDGRETDAQFSLQLQQASLARRQQIIAAYQAGNHTIAPLPLTPMPASSLRSAFCTSSLVGSTVYTTCSVPYRPYKAYKVEWLQ